MDINQLYTVDAHEKGAEMQLKDENSKPLDMYIKVVGVDSKLFREVKNKLRRDILADPSVDMEELKTNSLADITLGWRGFLEKGKEIKFSQKRILQLYQNAPYIADQIDMFCNARANFTKG